ncbi:MAG TPA: hypothetical protein VKE71_07105, partial [Candidatus Angelobacter sp.]|nr:hypothetical protein [Candidatus Angelobacter sp.]
VLEDTSGVHEKKIRALLQAAYSRDAKDSAEQQKYKDAARALKGSDHYMRIIVAVAVPRKGLISNVAIYVIIALAVALMIAALQIWTKGK